MASKESKEALRGGARRVYGGWRARAGSTGGGGRPRPRHAPTKGANWREEQGAGLGARLAARLEGACAGRGLLAEGCEHFRSRARGRGVGPLPHPHSPPSCGLAPSDALGSGAQAVAAKK